MSGTINEKALVAELKKKVEKELLERELDIIEYWKGEIDKLSHKKAESLGSLQIDLKDLVHRMENRIRILKKDSKL